MVVGWFLVLPMHLEGACNVALDYECNGCAFVLNL